MIAPSEKTVFAQAAFQFCGHLDDHLIATARDLVLVYFQTRFGSGDHLVRRYCDGRLVEERAFRSSRSIVFYYLRMWCLWRRELRRFVREKGSCTALFIHPLLAVLRVSPRRVRHVFWQWDYFPDGALVSRLFNAVARVSSRRVDDYHPLTAAIGRVMGRPDAKVVMLGMRRPAAFGSRESNRLLLVGQLRPGQGVEAVLRFLAEDSRFRLSLIGAAAAGFEREIGRLVRAGHLEGRVDFANRFISETELREVAKGCLAALAPYETNPSNLTNYADPGKVKSSLEMGLPVVMTRISEIAPFVERFRAGEVVDDLSGLGPALDRIRADYPAYLEGVRRFADHFACERIYAE